MSRPTVAIHCNAGGEHGMGHLMRAITIAAEAQAHGWSIALVGDVDDAASAMVLDRVESVSLHRIARADQADELLPLIRRLAPDVVHIDSYLPDADMLAATTALVSNVQDGRFGVRSADLIIDPNPGAELKLARSASNTVSVAGAEYALVRKQVRTLRGQWRPSPERSRVLVVLGGTDPHGLTPVLLGALSDCIRSLDITVVTPVGVRDAVLEVADRSPHKVAIVDFLDDLPAAAIAQDLVISAAGTSVWDFACMGVPTALVCVTENQEFGYDTAVERGLAVGLQRSPSAPWSHVGATVAEVLADTGRLHNLVRRGMETIDGLGAWRIVSSWEHLLTSKPRKASTAGVVARTASANDAQMLFEWRNDPDTRRMSRSTAPLDWDEHSTWLASVLSNPSRELLVIEQDGHPIGTVRWDHREDLDWEVSISLAPSVRGRGLSAAVLAAGEAAHTSTATRRLVATIHDTNEPSRRLFARAGYMPFKPADVNGFAEYAKLSVPSTTSGRHRLLP